MPENDHGNFGRNTALIRLVLQPEVKKLEAGADHLRALIITVELFARFEQWLQVLALDSAIVDVVLKLCELVEAVVMQHQRLVHVLLLVEKEHAQALAKQLFDPLFEIVRPAVLVGLVDDLDQALADRLLLSDFTASCSAGGGLT